MIQKRFQIFAVVLLACLLVNTAAFAGGGNRVGTSSGVQLLIPIGARYLAMGGAAAAFCEGVESIYWNPAGLAKMPTQANAMFSYTPWIADIGVSYGAVAVEMGNFGVMGASIKALNIGEIAVTTADQPDGTGEVFSPTFFTMSLSYAKQLTDQVAFGTNMNVISERLPRASATGVSIDAGIQYKNVGGLEGLLLGVVIKHIGPNMKYGGPGLYRQATNANSEVAVSHLKIEAGEFELPSQVEIALAYQTEVSDVGSVTASYLFQNNNFQHDQNTIGGEFNFKDLAFIRAGYTMGLDMDSDYDYIFGPSFGAGVHLKSGGVDFWIDYAFNQREYFDSGNIFSIKIGF
ncbi:PorV/PorQ family protein [candidate division KSB1 bacterium]|nr:PorV/PorQ family protein [candidate division KSB1 bacterium]